MMRKLDNCYDATKGMRRETSRRAKKTIEMARIQ